MRRRWIYMIVVLLQAVSLSAKRAAAPQPLPAERLQQFTYYRYAAKQAILEERYADAYILLLFCETLNPQDGSTHAALGVMYNALGDKERALQAYARAFENDPHDQWHGYTLALLEQHTREGRARALEVMEKAHRVNPTHEELLELLRQMYVSEGRYKQALKTQDEIDAIRGYDVYSAYNRTSTYALWGKPKKAIAEADRWLENEPANVQFMLYRIEMMERSGARAGELYEWYERVLRADAHNLMVLNNYAYLLATHGGDLSKAEQLSQLTIREEPENPVYLDTYGWIMHLQGQDQLALFYLHKALDKGDSHTQDEIRGHLAEIERGKR